MRTLKFIVEGQIIKPDPDCDFNNLVPGSEGYVRAHFAFSKEWAGCVKVAAFYSPMGREYPPKPLEDGHTCDIPAEALAKRMFKVQVIGKGNGLPRLTTNKLEVKQNGGKV